MGNTFFSDIIRPAGWLTVAGIAGFVLWVLQAHRSPGTKLRGPLRFAFVVSLYGRR
jgi:hypothetical protein